MTHFTSIKRFAQRTGLNFEVTRNEVLAYEVEVSNEKYTVRCKDNGSKLLFVDLIVKGECVLTRHYDTQREITEFIEKFADKHADAHIEATAEATTNLDSADVLELAKADAPEWLDTTECTTLEALVSTLVDGMEIPSWREHFKQLFITYGAFVPEHIKNNHPSLYPLIQDVEPSADVMKRLTNKNSNIEGENMTTVNKHTADVTEVEIIKNHHEQALKLRKERAKNKSGKKHITFGLTARTYGNMECKDELEQLDNMGCDIVYFETRASIDTKKSITTALLEELQTGDTLIVTNAFCLAKTTTHLCKVVLDLIDKGVKLISVKESWLDTTTDTNKELLLHFLKGIQGFEQDVITAHKNSAIEKAKHNGTKFGRNLKPNADLDRAVEMYTNNVHNYTLTKIAELNNISRTTLWRKLRDLRLLEGK